MLVFLSTLQAYPWIGSKETSLCQGLSLLCNLFLQEQQRRERVAQGIFLDEFLGICLLVAFPSSVSVIQGVSRGVVSEFQRLESPLSQGILLRKPHVLGLLA